MSVNNLSRSLRKYIIMFTVFIPFFYFKENTNRQLPWLKQIKESHGSVALTTLMQAEAINAF